MSFSTFEERLLYLKCYGTVGDDTFGYLRYLNQQLYTGVDWREHIRPYIIARDLGCDMALPGFEINDRIYIHHINPVTVEDFMSNSPALTDVNNLISVSYDTHQMIHYGNRMIHKQHIIERKPNDTCPWK